MGLIKYMKGVRNVIVLFTWYKGRSTAKLSISYFVKNSLNGPTIKIQ